MLLRRAFLFLALLGLSACSPLLTSFPEGVQDQLRGIKIDPIPDRSGQYLRLKLLKTLTPLASDSDPARTRLHITLTKTESVVGLAKDATTRRMRLNMTLTYTLKSIPKGAVLKTGTLRAYASYNYILNGFYASTVSYEAAEFETLDMLASLMLLELGRYFSDTGKKALKTDTAAP